MAEELEKDLNPKANGARPQTRLSIGNSLLLLSKIAPGVYPSNKETNVALHVIAVRARTIATSAFLVLLLCSGMKGRSGLW